jgi:hypothetical protein
MVDESSENPAHKPDRIYDWRQESQTEKGRRMLPSTNPSHQREWFYQASKKSKVFGGIFEHSNPFLFFTLAPHHPI